MPRPRRPRHHDRITFALDDVHDLEAGADGSSPAHPPGEDHPVAPAPPVSTVASTDRAPTDKTAIDQEATAATDGTADAARRRRRRTVLATAGVAALVVGGMVVVDAVASRPTAEALRRSPGGILSLADAPAELWSVPGPTGGGVAALPGLLVVVRDDEATAYDLDTGTARWSVDVPAGSTCGDSQTGAEQGATVPDDTLVCLTPDGPTLTTPGLPLSDRPTLVPGDPAVVTILDASGTIVATRTLDGGRGWSSVGPDGTIARFERVGAEPGGRLVDVDPASGRPTDLSGGRDAVVTLEDAATGAVRWERELPFVETDIAGGCQQHVTEDGTSYASLDGGRVEVLRGELLVAYGCGVDAWFARDGTRLDDPESSTDGVSALPGGSLAHDPEGSWSGSWAADERSVKPAVLRPDGAVRWEAPGRVLAPLTSDGSADELFLVQESADLVAYDATGTPLWTSRAASSPMFVYALAGGTVVAARSTDGAAVGIDAATGRGLWTLTPAAISALDDGRSRGEEGVPAAGLHVSKILTDGTRALVVVGSWIGDTSRIVALDLRDGHVAWTSDPTSAASYLAVQGRLLRVDDSTVTRLG